MKGVEIDFVSNAGDIVVVATAVKTGANRYPDGIRVAGKDVSMDKLTPAVLAIGNSEITFEEAVMRATRMPSNKAVLDRAVADSIGLFEAGLRIYREQNFCTKSFDLPY